MKVDVPLNKDTKSNISNSISLWLTRLLWININIASPFLRGLVYIDGILCSEVRPANPQNKTGVWVWHSTGSGGEVLVLEILRVWSTPSLLSFFCLFGSEVSVRVSSVDYPVGWGTRIHRQLLTNGVRPPPTKSVLDMTLNNVEVPVMLEL